MFRLKETFEKDITIYYKLRAKYLYKNEERLNIRDGYYDDLRYNAITTALIEKYANDENKVVEKNVFYDENGNLTDYAIDKFKGAYNRLNTFCWRQTGQCLGNKIQRELQNENLPQPPRTREFDETEIDALLKDSNESKENDFQNIVNDRKQNSRQRAIFSVLAPTFVYEHYPELSHSDVRTIKRATIAITGLYENINLFNLSKIIKIRNKIPELISSYSMREYNSDIDLFLSNVLTDQLPFDFLKNLENLIDQATLDSGDIISLNPEFFVLPKLPYFGPSHVIELKLEPMQNATLIEFEYLAFENEVIVQLTSNISFVQYFCVNATYYLQLNDEMMFSDNRWQAKLIRLSKHIKHDNVLFMNAFYNDFIIYNDQSLDTSFVPKYPVREIVNNLNNAYVNRLSSKNEYYLDYGESNEQNDSFDLNILKFYQRSSPQLNDYKAIRNLPYDVKNENASVKKIIRKLNKSTIDKILKSEKDTETADASNAEINLNSISDTDYISGSDDDNDSTGDENSLEDNAIIDKSNEKLSNVTSNNFENAEKVNEESSPIECLNKTCSVSKFNNYRDAFEFRNNLNPKHTFKIPNKFRSIFRTFPFINRHYVKPKSGKLMYIDRGVIKFLSIDWIIRSVIRAKNFTQAIYEAANILDTEELFTYAISERSLETQGFALLVLRAQRGEYLQIDEYSQPIRLPYLNEVLFWLKIYCQTFSEVITVMTDEIDLEEKYPDEITPSTPADSELQSKLLLPVTSSHNIKSTFTRRKVNNQRSKELHEKYIRFLISNNYALLTSYPNPFIELSELFSATNISCNNVGICGNSSIRDHKINIPEIITISSTNDNSKRRKIISTSNIDTSSDNKCSTFSRTSNRLVILPWVPWPSKRSTLLNVLHNKSQYNINSDNIMSKLEELTNIERSKTIGYTKFISDRTNMYVNMVQNLAIKSDNYLSCIFACSCVDIPNYAYRDVYECLKTNEELFVFLTILLQTQNYSWFRDIRDTLEVNFDNKIRNETNQIGKLQLTSKELYLLDDYLDKLDDELFYTRSFNDKYYKPKEKMKRAQMLIEKQLHPTDISNLLDLISIPNRRCMDNYTLTDETLFNISKSENILKDDLLNESNFLNLFAYDLCYAKKN